MLYEGQSQLVRVGSSINCGVRSCFDTGRVFVSNSSSFD